MIKSPATLSAILLGPLAVLLLGLPSHAIISTDLEIGRALAEWRADHVDSLIPLVWLTHLGGAPFLLGIAAVAAAITLRRKVAEALLLAAIVLGGRMMVELLKWAFDRPRPAFDAHPVTTFSHSFPSGHAGNSMITFLAIALIALPQRWRAAGVGAAILLALAVGATRPVLGVHWPSDVLGGWLFGLAWVLACTAAWRRFTVSGTGAPDCSQALPADR